MDGDGGRRPERPAAAAAVFFDFHPSTLAVPAVAWTLLAARRGDVRQCTIAALAVLLCRADLGCVLLGIAVVGTCAPGAGSWPWR